MLLITIWVGLIGALLMFAGDMLLYYTPKDFSLGPKSSTEERINATIDVMKGLPARPCHGRRNDRPSSCADRSIRTERVKYGQI